MHWLPLWMAMTALVDGGVSDVATLTVHATGFRHASGHAEAKLYHAGQDVLGPPAQRARAVIGPDGADFHFDGLEPGAYAVVGQTRIEVLVR